MNASMEILEFSTSKKFKNHYSREGLPDFLASLNVVVSKILLLLLLHYDLILGTVYSVGVVIGGMENFWKTNDKGIGIKEGVEI